MAKKRKKKKSHKKQYKKQIFISISCIIISISIYILTPKINSTFSNICNNLSQNLGFIVKDINISGAKNKTENLIRKEIKISKNDNIFKYSTNEIYESIMKVSWVESAIIRKQLPNIIDIKIVEKIPIAIFQNDSKFTLIDKNGDFIEDINNKPKNIPIVIGEESNIKAYDILKKISKFENINKNLESLTLIRKRRWNILCNGINIKLPELNIDRSLETASNILQYKNINKNTVNFIDLKSPENVIINNINTKESNKKPKTLLKKGKIV